MTKNLADAIARSIVALLPDDLELADRDYTFADFRIDFSEIESDDAHLADAFESFFDDEDFAALESTLQALNNALSKTSPEALRAALDSRYN